jgi:hypothetical protein
VADSGEGTVAGPGMLGCVEWLAAHTSHVCGGGPDTAVRGPKPAKNSCTRRNLPAPTPFWA